MQIEDINAVLSLAKQMHEESAYKHIRFDDQVFISTVADCMKNGFAWVGEADNEVVSGFLANITPYIFSNDRLACDYGVFTNKKHRKTRLAYKMLLEYIKWAKEQDAKEIMIGASEGFEQTWADQLGRFLQKRLGFKPAGHWYKLRN